MKKKMIGFCAAILVLMMAGSVNATYIGTESGNDDDVAEIVNLIENDPEFDIDLLGGGLVFLDKIDVDKGLVSGDYSISNLGSSGTWTAPDGTDVDFVTVKAGNNFLVFLADDFNWDTAAVGDKDISHITFWSAPEYDAPPPGGSEAVPEPATVALICAGIGVLGFNRIRGKKRVRD